MQKHVVLFVKLKECNFPDNGHGLAMWRYLKIVSPIDFSCFLSQSPPSTEDQICLQTFQVRQQLAFQFPILLKGLK